MLLSQCIRLYASIEILSCTKILLAYLNGQQLAGMYPANGCTVLVAGFAAQSGDCVDWRAAFVVELGIHLVLTRKVSINYAILIKKLL